ncbi:antirestriction protein ArdA [Listeria booriae]|uniref:antirestriction protein ArdA n=1 Tax=Listeria booriae TaxID=1552123 RepID=UPI002880797A|nr:antirestriction protein ArdA [Listeria booriae]MDT0109352.1 antirestriction protein ArdA [Listeria booriae]
MKMGILAVNPKRINGVKFGSWVGLPITREQLAKKLFLENELDEFVIEDSEVPFRIHESATLEYLNRVAILYQSNEGHPATLFMQKLVDDGWYSTIEEGFEKIGDIIIHRNCNTMVDVAVSFVKDAGYLDGVPDLLERNINYESIGEELKVSSYFYNTFGGVIFEMRF